MKKQSSNLFRVLFWFTLVVIVPTGIAVGYYYAMSTIPALTCPTIVDANTVKVNVATLRSDTSTTGYLRYVTVSKAEFDAMRCIFNQNSSVSDFRIYLGKDASGTIWRYVGGISGGTVNQAMLYKAASGYPANCPPLCDLYDPISPANTR
jgi:hypothetical protein